MRQRIAGQLRPRHTEQGTQAIEGNHQEDHAQADDHRTRDIALRVAGFLHQRADELGTDKAPDGHGRQRQGADLQGVPALVQGQLQVGLGTAHGAQAQGQQDHHHHHRQHRLQLGEDVDAQQVEQGEHPEYPIGHQHRRQRAGVDLADDQVQKQQLGGQGEHRHHHVAGEGREDRREMPDGHLGVAAQAAGPGHHQRQFGKRQGIGQGQQVGQQQRDEEAQPGHPRPLQHQHHHPLGHHQADSHRDQ